MLMIRIGTSGFSFDDWKGTVYPQGLKKNDWLAFYEKELGFKALEVNFTYYALASQKSFEGMSRKTSDDFEFVVKAHRDMTHNIRDRATKKIVDTGSVCEKFIFSLEPLMRDKKLSCVLMQFPFSFHCSRDNVEYLRRIRDLAAGIPVVVEFRNRAWLREETFSFLREHDMGYCAVDEPRLKGLVPFVSETTSSIGYLRLHGRNKKWFDSPMSVRYNYCYTDEELKGFVGPVRTMDGRVRKMLVFFNNCHAGHAAKNAVRMAHMLLGDKTV